MVWLKLPISSATCVCFVSNTNRKKQVKTSIESCHLDRPLLQVRSGRQTPSSPYLPIYLSCHLTGLSGPIRHVCDYVTEAIDWERVDEGSPVSLGLRWRWYSRLLHGCDQALLRQWVIRLVSSSLPPVRKACQADSGHWKTLLFIRLPLLITKVPTMRLKCVYLFYI